MTDALTTAQQQRVQFLLHGWSSIAAFANALQQVESSAELQEFIKHYNWDSGYDAIELVMQHPLCDRGTALEAYWLGQPELFAYIAKAEDIPSYNRDLYHFHRMAESILLADDFQHRAVLFDPLSSYPEEKRRGIAKYAQIPDELLLPTGVDSAQRQAAIDQLNDYKAAPDDADSLNFLANKYLRMHDPVQALASVERSLSVDSKCQQTWTLKKTILTELEKLHDLSSTAADSENTYPDSYPDIQHIRRELVGCLEALMQMDSDRQDSNAIASCQYEMAELYLRNEDYGPAVELLEALLATAQAEDIPRYILDSSMVTKQLVAGYQGLEDFDRALHYLDVWLDDSLPDGYLCFHKVKLLQEIGRTEDAEALLNQIVDKKARDIEASKADGNPVKSDLHQMATLLKDFRQDYGGAADVLQEIIDLGLFYSANDETKLRSRVQALRGLAEESA